MMLEIKFRAWIDEGEEKAMLPVSKVSWEPGKVFVECPIATRGGKVSCRVAEREFYRTVLMQYTGLKDKNGNEIYEGDILQLGVFPGQEKSPNSEVEFIGGSFCIEHKDFRKEMSKNKHGAWVYLDVEADEGEVIGNIYESPELLKEE